MCHGVPLPRFSRNGVSVLRALPSLLLLAALCGCASATTPREDASPGAETSRPDVSLAEASTAGCALPLGGTCPAGESCPAGDGCNTCSCNAAGQLACTRRACVLPCTSSADCPSGMSCAFGPSCDTPRSCQPVHSCPAIATTFCDCAGQTYVSSSVCPTRPIAHGGPCEVADAGSCAAEGQPCARGPDCCSGYCPQQGADVSVCRLPPAGYVGCGVALCRAGAEYCETRYSDTNVPDSQRCRPLPSGCAAGASCGCIPTEGCSCASASGSSAVLQCPGG